MQQFKKLNNIVGWVVFAFALFVYASTMESNASFWDCGEFIAGAYKLEVVHPPGAPFFLMLGRIFTFFSFGNVELVALTINFLSALSTAFAVLFAFWSITMLAKKVVFKDGNYSKANIAAVLGAGIVGALSCTFLDSLWFSAAEGEVYALSIFFMALVLWAILKWEAAEGKYQDRWILVIAFSLGLSTGVHLLSLLAIPVVTIVYYFKKYKPTLIGTLIAFGSSFIIIGIVMKVIISGIPFLASRFDFTFVNGFGLPFNSGVYTLIILLVILNVFALYYTHKKKYASLNTLILALTFIVIGFSSYIMVPIRSSANPAINMNRPEDAFSVLSYINREQYGDRPLLFGPAYNADQYDIEKVDDSEARIYKGEEEYYEAGAKLAYVWKDEVKMFFPRLGFWQEKRHENAYRSLIKPDFNVVDRAANNKVVKTYKYDQLEQARNYVAGLNSDQPRYTIKDKIGMKENIQFFLQYQVGFMYMRYFMWNFAGRQNDVQGLYNNNHGGWISGIGLLDGMLEGVWGNPGTSDDEISESQRNNMARNKFFLLPFILGLIGMVYMYKQNKRVFSVVMILFLITGLIQIIYHNQPPIEPRERDYVLAGSFYAYTIWIGFGLLSIFNWLKRITSEMNAAAVAFGICLIVPFLMGSQGWDDHDRSGRFIARDFARNYLESVAPNAILFTQGDNDTYPLWYAQEVEGIRTDVRIVNLSLLGVDWYIDQLRVKTNDGAPIKLSFAEEQTKANNRDVTRYRAIKNAPSGHLELAQVMKFIASEDRSNMVNFGANGLENYLPSKKFKITVDTAKAIELGMIPDSRINEVEKTMKWSINKNTLLKNDLLTLDIIASNFPERPIYYAVSVSPDAHMGLSKYIQLEGLAYRVVPLLNSSGNSQSAPVNTEASFKAMTEKFTFGGIPEKKNIYIDENITRMTMNLKGNYIRLSDALIKEGKKEKALIALQTLRNGLPPDRVEYNIFDLGLPRAYYQCGDTALGSETLFALFDKAESMLDYQVLLFQRSVTDAKMDNNKALIANYRQGSFGKRRPVQEGLYMMQELVNVAKQNLTPEIHQDLSARFQEYQTAFILQN